MTEYVWIARDNSGTIRRFFSKPHMDERAGEWLHDGWQGWYVPDVFQQIKPGECKKFKVILEEVKDDD